MQFTSISKQTTPNTYVIDNSFVLSDATPCTTIDFLLRKIPLISYLFCQTFGYVIFESTDRKPTTIIHVQLTSFYRQMAAKVKASYQCDDCFSETVIEELLKKKIEERPLVESKEGFTPPKDFYATCYADFVVEMHQLRLKPINALLESLPNKPILNCADVQLAPLSREDFEERKTYLFTKERPRRYGKDTTGHFYFAFPYYDDTKTLQVGYARELSFGNWVFTTSFTSSKLFLNKPLAEARGFIVQALLSSQEKIYFKGKN